MSSVVGERKANRIKMCQEKDDPFLLQLSPHFQVLYFVSISTAEGPLILPSVNQSLFQMSLLNDLLSSLLQVGQLYAQQGAVREAFRQFVDGLTLARHFALPYRYSL